MSLIRLRTGVWLEAGEIVVVDPHARPTELAKTEEEQKPHHVLAVTRFAHIRAGAFDSKAAALDYADELAKLLNERR
jgi:hypothetical protein